MYNKRFMFIPFGVSRAVFYILGGRIGYADYRIFGIRIARIQETKPY